MKLKKSFALFMMASLLMSGCAYNKQGTIGALKVVNEPEPDINLDNLDHATVRSEYQEILDLIDDKSLKQQIERRIADVYLLEGEKVLVEGPAKAHKSYYNEAIKSYREVLEKYPNSPDNDEVIYQLAKAYDMEGEQEAALQMLTQLTSGYPQFKHNPEAYFRIGDINFNNKNYREAENAYEQIIKSGDAKLRINAHYMMGWSLYKQGMYEDGLNHFFVVLDDLLAQTDDIEALEPADQQLARDTLHSMSLALVHNGGAEHIDNVGRLSKKDYVWLVYEELGEHYLEKERFEDSAQTYRHFVVRYSKSDKAPELHSKLIDVYIKGGFPLQALTEKERYVEFYGLHSGYKGMLGGIKPELKPSIKIYLDELAKHYHADAQGHQKTLEKIDPQNNASKYKSVDSLAMASFSQAAKFYSEYLESFPADEKNAEITYLRGETYFAAKEYVNSISDYESVAYELEPGKDEKRSSEAGYAAIIAYQKLIDRLGKDSRKGRATQELAVVSMLRFTSKFQQDPRSPAVLTNAAEYLFTLDEFERALAVANTLIEGSAGNDKSLRKTAFGIKAHSLFNLKRYSEAELAYIEQRKLVDEKNDEYAQISERIASSVYKYSEILVIEDRQLDAVNQLLKIKKLAPDSGIRVSAQYDAATMMLAMGQWKPAITEFKQLQSLYIQHDLSVEFPRKIAFAQEKDEQWQEAADSYLDLSHNDPDEEIKREAMFVSATLYEKVKDYETSIILFKRYAHRYPQPFNTRMEARYHLATNYEALDDKTRHLYWLRRVIDGDKKGGEQRSDRSRWLGAWANAKYGDYWVWEFKRRKLRMPLENSLPKKNENLKNATDRYQMAADYGILEYVTLSSYKIAELYNRFAEEIRNVKEPAGLNEADVQIFSQILDQQAQPFTNLAIELHQSNIDRGWDGAFNEWINNSFQSMKVLQPERFNKNELEVSYGDEIR